MTTSALESFTSEAIQQDTITLKRIQLTEDNAAKRTLLFECETATTITDVPVFDVDDPSLQRDGYFYVPSKVMITPTQQGIQLDLLFFVGECLPQTTRPFKDKLYIAIIDASDRDICDVTYRASDRMLIDQVHVNGNIYYIFVFDENTAKNILEQ